ncbi:MAG: response regulator [Clostridiaceae bacterium]|nr:response regulator [Clostridiaceae bacterium]
MYGLVIADDELIIRQGLMTIPWNEYDIEVMGIASNGSEALDMVMEKCPDILLTDIRMPGMDGLALIEAAKKYNPEIQAILLTGYEDFEYARDAIRLGAIGYILKPSDPEEIIESIERAKKKLEEIHGRNNISANNSKVKNRIICKLIEYIEEHYKEDITLQTAADYVHMNHIYISRLFKRETGETFLDYLTKFRLKRACVLLMKNEYKIYEIALEVGITDSGYFSQVFRKYYGMTPSEYRNRLFSGEIQTYGAGI